MPELKVKIGGDATGFRGAVQSAQSIAQSGARSLAATVGGAFSSPAFTGPIAAAIGFITAGMKSAISSGGNFQDLSAQTGINTEKLQQWGLAAKQAGSDINSVVAGVSKMAVKISEALDDPAGEAAQNFKKLGITIEDLKADSLEETFERVAAKVHDSAVDAQLIATVMGTLGKGGAALIPTFKQGLTGSQSFNTTKEISDLDEIGDTATEVMNTFRVMFGRWATKLRTPLSILAGNGIPRDKPVPPGQPLITTEAVESTADRRKREGEEKADADAEKKAEAEHAAMLERADRISEQVARNFQRNNRAAMSDEERRNDLLRERTELAAELNKITEFNEEELERRALRITEIDGELGKDSKPKSSRDSFRITADAAARIGGSIGGSGPGMVADMFGRATLTAAQQTARNTAAVAAALKEIAARPQADWGTR